MERKYPQTVCGGDIQGKSVIQVTCGGMHTVALSEDGNVRKLCIFCAVQVLDEQDTFLHDCLVLLLGVTVDFTSPIFGNLK